LERALKANKTHRAELAFEVPSLLYKQPIKLLGKGNYRQAYILTYRRAALSAMIVMEDSIPKIKRVLK